MTDAAADDAGGIRQPVLQSLQREDCRAPLAKAELIMRHVCKAGFERGEFD